MAKLASGAFAKTTIYALDENSAYRNSVNGVHLVQGRKYAGALDKYRFYLDALLRQDYSLRCPPEAIKGLDKNSVLQIEGPYYYNLLKAAGVKRYVLNEANVYWELQGFPAYSRKDRIYNRMTAARNKDIELKAVRDAAQIMVCSEVDRNKLIEQVPDAESRITVIPNCVHYPEYRDYARAHAAEAASSPVKKVLFVGSYNYSPNVEAVHTICRRIAPEFGPEVRFVLAGKNPPAVQSPANVEFTGYVSDLKRQILESDLCIAPISHGSGTRFKILEYMAMGKPVVSTSKGAEGIDYTDGKDLVIEDDPGKFADRIRELLADPGDMGPSASDLIARKYDWQLYERSLRRVYEYAMADI